MSELADIRKKVKSINDGLASDIKKKKNSMVISLVGGLIILIIVLIYFSYIKGLIREVVEPKGLMLYARDRIQTVLPEVSKNLEKQLKDEAPNIAKYSKEELLKNIPMARKYLENQFIMKTEEALDQFILEFDKMVTEALEENRPIIVGFMRDVSDDEKKKELSQQIYESLKQHFDQDYIKADIDSYTKVIIRLNQKIKYIYETEELTEEEIIVRDIIYAMRELAQRGAQKNI